METEQGESPLSEEERRAIRSRLLDRGIYSSCMRLVRKWTKDKGSLIGRMIELSVSFLKDEDTVHLTDRIFWYMMG